MFYTILRTHFRHPNFYGYKIIQRSFLLSGRIAIITGGADEVLRLATAKQLIKNGVAAVALGDIHREDIPLKEICGKYGPDRPISLKTDVSKPDQFKTLLKTTIDKYDKFDILIKNARNVNKEEINTVCSFNGNQLAMECLSKEKSGKDDCAVRISSLLGLQPFAGSPVYIGAKHFLIGFDRSIDNNWHYKKTGVKVLSICTGVTSTKLIENVNGKAHKSSNNEMGRLLEDSFAELPQQPVEACGRHMVTIITKGVSGSIWIPEADIRYKMKLLDRKKFQKTRS